MSTTALLEGVAARLAAGGVGVWRSTGLYAEEDVAIVLGGLPQSPDSSVALAAYGVADDPALSDSTEGLQVTVRRGGRDPRPVLDLADAVFGVLQGVHGVDLGGVRVVLCLRRSWSLLGQDGNGRWRLAQNFYVDIHRPSLHRI